MFATPVWNVVFVRIAILKKKNKNQILIFKMIALARGLFLTL